MRDTESIPLDARARDPPARLSEFCWLPAHHPANTDTAEGRSAFSLPEPRRLTSGVAATWPPLTLGRGRPGQVAVGRVSASLLVSSSKVNIGRPQAWATRQF